MSDNEKKKTEELNDEELEGVSGGISVKRGPTQGAFGQVQTKMPSAGIAQTPVVKPVTMPKTVKK